MEFGFVYCLFGGCLGVSDRKQNGKNNESVDWLLRGKGGCVKFAGVYCKCFR